MPRSCLGGIALYSPATRVLVAQKFAENNWSDNSWRQIRMGLFCSRRGCEGVTKPRSNHFGTILQHLRSGAFRKSLLPCRWVVFKFQRWKGITWPALQLCREMEHPG